MAFLRRYHPALALLLASSARADWVQTTVADQAAADKLLSLLLLQFDEKDLQIHTADVQSFYRRDGAVVEEREVRFTVDSALNVDRLRTAVEGVHPHQSPIIVSHSTGNLIKEKGAMGKYLLGEYSVKVGAEHIGPMSKILVEHSYAASVSVDLKEDEAGGHRVSFYTTGASKPHMLREFAHTFQWTPIHGNKIGLEYVDANVKVRKSDEL